VVVLERLLFFALEVATGVTIDDKASRASPLITLTVAGGTLFFP
jgi:hypothetical protein